MYRRSSIDLLVPPSGTSNGNSDDANAREQTKEVHKGRRRVFVPSVGTFDLSSGSESEDELDDVGGEKEEGEDDDDDDASVYSVDDDAQNQLAQEETARTRIGRKLTIVETRRHQGKLHRGIQRALSQRNLNTSAAN
ncbi:hypothetical protein CBS101457_001781 [Exobasidium rhododendri]|nr:hypothetical protein CBS101457_001781 [Exobasidium rhododendri]